MDAMTISVKETARVLGLGRTSIYSMIADNRIETIKIGRRTLVKTASLRRLIENG